MNLLCAQNLCKGQTLYHKDRRNADGTAQRWKVTSVKTWKTRPDCVRVKLQNGLRNFGTIDETQLDILLVTDPTK